MIEVKAGGISLFFEENEEEKTARLVSFKGSDSKLLIPETVGLNDTSYEVSEISKKAFLGCKGLKEVELHKGIRAVGDWGFSQCIHLRRVSFASINGVTLGKNVFEGCERLEEIRTGDKEEALSKLLAAVVNRLPNSHLLNDSDIGSKEWYERFDLGLKAFLLQDDYEGYSDRALCGEEDISYDGIGSVDGELLGESSAYVRKVSKDKCGLVLLRLSNNIFLEESMEAYLKEYIRLHSKGNGNEAAWTAIKEDFKDNLDYLELYLLVAEVDAKGIDELISDMGNDMAQAKAFLIKKASGNGKTDNFFSDLML